jgi:HAD superfamily phosphatase (TIGR01668 family)
MSSLFVPDYIFRKFDDISVDFLRALGIKALLIDIDNTLAPYEVAEPDGRIKAWFENLRANGISAALISNNEKERVELFNRSLGLPYYYKSGKPFAKNMKKAMALMGSDSTNTAMLGDQLLTDAAAGKRLGLVTFIVPPIKDKSNAFFRTKRALEVPSIKRYVKKHGGESESICDFWLNKRYKTKRG